jgi:sugar O-acyltransferase (sialic acid O-acetyltransferase NeuD family)
VNVQPTTAETVVLAGDRSVQRLVVLGAGGFAREVLAVVDAVNALRKRYEVVGLVAADEPDSEALRRHGQRFLGDDRVLETIDARYVIAIGAPDVRRRLDQLATAYGLEAATLVHPGAMVGATVRLGPGVIVAAGARLTDSIVVGRHTHINLNATVGHDCVLGDYVTVNPLAAISGACVLDDDVTVGTGAAIIQQRRVGAGSTVAAGAALLHDLEPGMTAIGNPARPLRWRRSPRERGA